MHLVPQTKTLAVALRWTNLVSPRKDGHWSLYFTLVTLATKAVSSSRHLTLSRARVCQSSCHPAPAASTKSAPIPRAAAIARWCCRPRAPQPIPQHASRGSERLRKSTLDSRSVAVEACCRSAASQKNPQARCCTTLASQLRTTSRWTRCPIAHPFRRNLATAMPPSLYGCDFVPVCTGLPLAADASLSDSRTKPTKARALAQRSREDLHGRAAEARSRKTLNPCCFQNRFRQGLR